MSGGRVVSGGWPGGWFWHGSGTVLAWFWHCPGTGSVPVPALAWPYRHSVYAPSHHTGSGPGCYTPGTPGTPPAPPAHRHTAAHARHRVHTVWEALGLTLGCSRGQTGPACHLACYYWLFSPLIDTPWSPPCVTWHGPNKTNTSNSSLPIQAFSLTA